MERVEHFDVLIIGAGLSGVGAACLFEQRCPGLEYAILEARQQAGGTWDLFRYPGIRSDSDMHTLGYGFEPWKGRSTLGEGASIRTYVQDTARRHGVDRHIRFGHRVLRATWSSSESRWTVESSVGDDGRPSVATCRFLHVCSGYYDYARGHAPDWPGMDSYGGRLVHPQHWPGDLDYSGKRVVVIGSGATAVTLVPAMAAAAAHVTMLQRSPTYVMSLPGRDVIADALQRVLPARFAYRLVRWKNVGLSLAIYSLCRHAPTLVKKLLRRGVLSAVGPGYDVDTHFGPKYAPWDQRLCFVPDNDLFVAVRAGRASVVTDQIRSFDESGIELESGRHLDADIVVSATGLRLLPLGGIVFSIDGAPVSLANRLAYRGLMLDGIPNVAFCIGYTNASWTLRADMVSGFVCRLLNHMRRRGYASCTPRSRGTITERRPLLGLSSGYVRRSIGEMPCQGDRDPWMLHQNHIREWFALRFASPNDPTLEFVREPSRPVEPGPVEVALKS